MQYNQKISLIASIKSVLSGLALGIISPFMSGDYIGRLMGLPLHKKKLALVANFTGSTMQVLASIWFGTLALAKYYFLNTQFPWVLQALLICLILSSILGTMLIFSNQKWLSKSWKAAFIEQKFHQPKDLLITLVLSLLRHLIFGVQFLLICKALSINLPTEVILTGIGLLLLVKTVGGGLNIFGDLIIRQTFGLYFFVPFGGNPETISLAVFILWIINVAIPSLIGGYFIFTRKSINSTQHAH